jgi:outer membrane lipoprotein SlyB
METQAKTRIHPLVAAASVAVIIFSAVGVAAITGYLPGSSAQKGADLVPSSPVAAVASQPPAALAPPAAVEPPAPRAAPKPVQKPAQTATPKTQVAAAKPAPAPKAICADCGAVAEVREVEVKGEGSGVGAVAGGVAGAVIGNQIGSGGTRTVARIAGAAGGAYAGHEIEKRARSQKRYDVVVRMEGGGERTVSSNSPPSWRVGDRVRIVDGKLELDR